MLQLLFDYLMIM